MSLPLGLRGFVGLFIQSLQRNSNWSAIEAW